MKGQPIPKVTQGLIDNQAKRLKKWPTCQECFLTIDIIFLGILTGLLQSLGKIDLSIWMINSNLRIYHETPGNEKEKMDLDGWSNQRICHGTTTQPSNDDWSNHEFIMEQLLILSSSVMNGRATVSITVQLPSPRVRSPLLLTLKQTSRRW
jgi:hypothetical protein